MNRFIKENWFGMVGFLPLIIGGILGCWYIDIGIVLVIIGIGWMMSYAFAQFCIHR
jgi:hypothetical protein